MTDPNVQRRSTILHSLISGPQTFSVFFSIMKLCGETVLCNQCAATSTFWKCVWFRNMGSVTKVMSVKVKNVTWRFCQFFPSEWSNDLSEESLPISTLSWSRIVSCSESAFYALSHSMSKCWHAFCHVREWQTSDISRASLMLSRPNGAKIMAPRWRHARAKSFPHKWARQNESISHSPAFASWFLPIWPQKKILSSFSIFRDP